MGWKGYSQLNDLFLASRVLYIEMLWFHLNIRKVTGEQVIKC